LNGNGQIRWTGGEANYAPGQCWFIPATSTFRHPALARIFIIPRTSPTSPLQKALQEAGVSPDALSRTVSAEVVPSRNWASRDLHSLCALCVLCVKFFSLTWPAENFLFTSSSSPEAAARAFGRVAARARPKQLLNIIGKQTMLEQTVRACVPHLARSHLERDQLRNKPPRSKSSCPPPRANVFSPNQSAAIRPRPSRLPQFTSAHRQG